jgi:hypothetical protein
VRYGRTSLSRPIMCNMAMRMRRNEWQTVTVVLVLCALLVSLLPQHDHVHVAMTGPLLLVIFLFGTVDIWSSLWKRLPSSEACCSQCPDLPSRFQRPPPASL